MLLGMEVGLGPGAFVFDVDPAPTTRKKGTAPTQFLGHVCCVHGCPSQLLLSSCLHRPTSAIGLRISILATAAAFDV